MGTGVLELRSARRLIVLSIVVLTFAVGTLIATALDVARWVDRRSGEVERGRVAGAIASLSRLRPDIETGALALGLAHDLGLQGATLMPRGAPEADQLGVALDGGRTLVWTAPRVGLEARAHFAPRRVPMVICATLVVAFMLYRLGRLATALDRERAQASAVARRDVLTGIGNRLAYDEALKARFAAAVPFALVCMDLDGFKRVNDQHGHAAGDAVLAGVAERLQRLAAEGDALFRLGGDEFAMLLADDGRDLSRVARKVALKLDDTYDLGGGAAAKLSASVGFAMAPQDGMTPRAVMQAADAALYAVKAQGGRECRRAIGGDTDRVAA